LAKNEELFVEPALNGLFSKFSLDLFEVCLQSQMESVACTIKVVRS